MYAQLADLGWKHFQDLCADILESEGFKVIRRLGVGPDRGSDIIAERIIEYGPRSSRAFRWIVQCKHRKSSTGSVRPQDIGDFLSDIPRHQADGYWLMTNGHLSSSLEDKLSSVAMSEKIQYLAIYSDESDILNFLAKYRFILCKYSLHHSLAGYSFQSDRSPFKELQPYTEGDCLNFFGRTEEKNDLMDQVYMHSIVGLFGESGVGKTSLIQAGIVPMLRQEGLIPVVIRCLDDPVTRIRRSVLSCLEEEKVDNESLKHIAAADTFADFVVCVKRAIGRAQLRIVLAIDQLEELFTRCKAKQRRSLAEGILEAASVAESRSSIKFLLSLREDYIGELWDWSHGYGLQGAWINTYRIGRLTEDTAAKVVANLMAAAGYIVNEELVSLLTQDLKILGGGYIYPPYLQLACSRLFSGKITREKAPKVVEPTSYIALGRAEEIVATYIGRSMLEGLNKKSRVQAEQILDLLTGPEGLRAFLTAHEIAWHLQLEEAEVDHVLEHLTQKKVVHPVVEEDRVVGYELVHDFLSRRFFESLSKEAKKLKTVFEIFRRASREWRQYGVLAGKDRLEMFRGSVSELRFTDEDYEFLLKSSLDSYQWINPWSDIIPDDVAFDICLELIKGGKSSFAVRAVAYLGKIKKRDPVPELKKLILSKGAPSNVRRQAILAFTGYWGIMDRRILPALQAAIRTERSGSTRVSAIEALERNLRHASDRLRSKYSDILKKSLKDSRLQVRRRAVLALANIRVPNLAALLVERLSEEGSIAVRIRIVETLRRHASDEPEVEGLLQSILADPNEDLRIQQAAVPREKS